MRIITGSLGGRQFDSPGSHTTHPMSDKMRGALFAILGDISGLTILDAFAGSGALAFEALSRGAKSAVIIDNDQAAQRTIARNIKTLKLETQAKLISTSSSSWQRTNPDARFDVVLCDPPYDDVHADVLVQLTACIAPDGLFVLSYPGKQNPPEYGGLSLVKQQSYGDGQLLFYRR